MTCLLRDGRDLLPAWHRLETDNAAARRLRRGGTWGQLHVPLSPREGRLREPWCAVGRWTWLCLRSLIICGFFPLSLLGVRMMVLPRPFPKGSAGDLRTPLWPCKGFQGCSCPTQPCG